MRNIFWRKIYIIVHPSNFERYIMFFTFLMLVDCVLRLEVALAIVTKRKPIKGNKKLYSKQISF